MPRVQAQSNKVVADMMMMSAREKAKDMHGPCCDEIVAIADEIDHLRGILREIWDICHRPCAGTRHAQICALTKPFVEET